MREVRLGQRILNDSDEYQALDWGDGLMMIAIEPRLLRDVFDMT